MRLPPDHSMAYVDGSKRPPLTTDDYVELTAKITDGDPVDPLQADQFLNTRFNPNPSRFERLAQTAIPPAALIAASWLTKTITHQAPEIQIGIDLPMPVHVAANDLWDYMPGEIQAYTPDVLHHVPGGLMLLAAGGIIGRAAQLNRRVNRERSFYEAQQELSQQEANGVANWDLAEIDRPIIGYVGHGQPVTNSLAQSLGERFMQIARQKVDGLHVVLPEKSLATVARKAYYRADVANADQIAFFPGAPEYEIFTPSGANREYYGVGADRIAVSLKRIDNVCDEAGVAHKPVKIFGNPDQPVIYAAANEDEVQDAPTKVVVDKTTITLEDRARELEQERGASVEVVDMTKLAMTPVIALADKTHRPLRLAGSEVSIATYLPAFKQAVRGRTGVDWSLPPERLVYAFSDRTSQIEAGPEDYVIVRESERRSDFLQKGIQDDHIFALPDLILGVLDES